MNDVAGSSYTNMTTKSFQRLSSLQEDDVQQQDPEHVYPNQESEPHRPCMQVKSKGRGQALVGQTGQDRLRDGTGHAESQSSPADSGH